MIIIHARLYVKPECVEAFLEKSKALVAGSQAEEGNISYNLFRQTDEPETFIVVEEWKDMAAIDFHNSTPHFTGFFAEAGGCFAKPAQVKRLLVEREI
ncbi:putative quinol monooxygenase [Paenibacillus sp. YN15]|uniref:putative quinol monooxygenase n=1 Tax=Paenibacillus sp. YN15 TaxID=1742774 RepID=UPI000DCCE07D|nr:putative quinol monooxygenase [Paenibacillus sp. YN15]RAU99559.1 antibiotic biosynthesis monooxygenase [Paenibacillus sp. YN15]